MKIGDIFLVGTGRRIVEEEVYLHQGDFPCVTSQTAADGITWRVDKTWIECKYKKFIVNEDCITWTKDGAKCGTMFFRNYEFYPNDHCGVLVPKKEYKEEINLEWFIYQYQYEIKEQVNQQGSQGMLYNEEMSEIEVQYPFPEREYQDRIVSEIYRIDNLKNDITHSLMGIDGILKKELILEKSVNLTVGDIALLNKGSNKISEEMIYRNYDEDGVPVYSSATENEGLMGNISWECYNLFEKKGVAQELTWTTNGYAGVVFLRNSEYIYSEKCGRITIRKKYKDLVNIKYLYYILNQITFKYKTSESNNGKLDIIHMSDIPVPLPLDKDEKIDYNKQKEIVDLYDRIAMKKNELLIEKARLECLM